MTAVNSAQRRLLENVVGDARVAAERAAKDALDRLAVNQNDPFATLSPEERALRNQLRAEARRLGTFSALVTEIAYQHWHRILFARFLAENDLLMYEGSDTPVTLQDCADIADEIGETDAWAVATRYAAAMLPGVFRLTDPVLQIRFAAEGRQALETLLGSLPSAIFQADDSLGWVYQFWQAQAKEAVNKSGRKIGGADISPVTQLFTEHYMVQFLLHNSLGAWWAGKHPGEELPTELSYLRRGDDGRPAAGTFPDWPATAKELRILDPSCGSGHFLVAAFSLMLRFRMAEEGLSECEAGDAVLRDNLFGLELDPRCTQIAAFALALTAWKHGGYRVLPLPNIACSGIRLGGTEADWRKLAGRDGIMQAVLQQVRNLFALAPDLGSLIDPHTIGQAVARAPRPAALPASASGSVLQMGLLPTATPTLWEGSSEAGDDWAGGGRLSPLVEMERLLPKLAEAAERFGDDTDDAPIFGEAAKQAVRAVGLLAGKYHLVITNVPYLGRGNQGDVLRTFCATNYPDAKADLATVFVRRCLQFCETGGSTALVTPQNWLFLGSYASLRGYLLRQKTWDVVAKLGENGFESPQAAGAFVGLFVLTNAGPKTGFVPEKTVDPLAAHAEACRRLEELFDKVSVPRRDTIYGPRTGTLDEERLRQFEAEFDSYAEQYPGERGVMERIRDEYRQTLAQSEAYHAAHFAGLDVSAPRSAREKDELLRTAPVQMVGQAGQLNNPDSRIALDEAVSGKLLESYAVAFQGIKTGDDAHFRRNFWEIPSLEQRWHLYQSTVEERLLSGGCEFVIDWYDTGRSMARLQGLGAWKKPGVAVSQMRILPVSLYGGVIFDSNMSPVVPKDPAHLPAIWCFCSSPEFHSAVRRIDQALKVTNASLVKVPFDLAHWQKVADEKYPDGLPEPHSDDPTQWLFDGHPAHAKGAPGDALQVAVARLLGYRWPRQTGAEIPGCHLLPDDGLSAFADADGIVCLPPVSGEPPAAERLRAFLGIAFGTSDDTHATVERLLADAGYGGKSLDEYLRNGFFAQHLKRFHNRPFLWQIWDGNKDGFSAIVNYHTLTRAKLEKLTYSYLNDWIKHQSDDDQQGIAGASARLVDAQALKKKLEAILLGDAPFDIYVRWKTDAQQPVGWEPDLNDGVRMNIRPFVTAEILRVRKPSINWNKDRGTNPDGTERHNDLHLTLVEKRAVRS